MPEMSWVCAVNCVHVTKNTGHCSRWERGVCDLGGRCYPRMRVLSLEGSRRCPDAHREESGLNVSPTKKGRHGQPLRQADVFSCEKLN